MNNCTCQLHIWEDIHGVMPIQYFPEHRAYLPYWMAYVKDATAKYEYVHHHRHDWCEADSVVVDDDKSSELR